MAGSVRQRLFAHLHASCSARTDVDDGAREMTAETRSLGSNMSWVEHAAARQHA